MVEILIQPEFKPITIYIYAYFCFIEINISIDMCAFMLLYCFLTLVNLSDFLILSYSSAVCVRLHAEVATEAVSPSEQGYYVTTE